MSDIILARDEAECVKKLLDGLEMAVDAARQLGMQYRQDEGKGWLAYANQIEAGRKIAAALIHEKQKNRAAIIHGLTRPKLIKPSQH